MGAIVFCLIDVPFRVCFEMESSPTDPYELWNLIVDLFLCCDIALNFRTGFTDPHSGFVVMDNRAIALHYATGWFPLDFVTSVPIGWLLSVSAESGGNGAHHGINRTLKGMRMLRAVKIIRLMKVLRVFKLMRSMSQWESGSSSVSSKAVRVARLFLLIFLLAHICACGLMGVANLDRYYLDEARCGAVLRPSEEDEWTAIARGPLEWSLRMKNGHRPRPIRDQRMVAPNEPCTAKRHWNRGTREGAREGVSLLR